MRCTLVILVAAISVVSLVSSYPVADERGFRSEMIEQKVNTIVAEVLRVLGPVLLRSVLGNNNGRNGGGGGDFNKAKSDGSTVTIASPFDDEEQGNKDDADNETGSRFNSMSSNGSRVSISLPTFPPDEDEGTEAPDTSTTTTTTTTTDSGTGTTTTTTTATSQSTTTTTVESKTDSDTSDVNPEAENRVNEVGSESQNNEVRVQFADEQPANEAAPELTPLEEVESSDDENRNKRFLNFGFGAGANAGGSAAGSGNFLFDIIRMVAGSGGQPDNSSGGVVAGKVEEPQEAIPGPITRLFVIANRGISNLLQDLILRLAATSERVVNFKARLITSII
ncbi:hypothetical protein KPH14_006965 [Odynerus spinipes]|uniref:Uncharacterized protein n=1 Tax=Odynerus spinipes TaxID=1348599 RepID=A0AAD9VSM8_9HYME|nr:hypothetical protein KPH14_006965 [Odynerus spinipes]